MESKKQNKKPQISELTKPSKNNTQIQRIEWCLPEEQGQGEGERWVKGTNFIVMDGN